MGIRDLIAWTKKSYPSAITNYPKRWASPQIRGKRIAIDGTLLTNRFHFAIQDGPLKGKGGLVGWFNLINILRKFDIKPVAIWDERGVREWKAPEAARRLATRAQNLARRKHEDERIDRLSGWKEALQELDSLSEDERSAVRGYFANTSIPPRRSRTSIQEKLEATTDLGVEDMESALDRVTGLIDDLSTLKTAYETGITQPPKTVPKASPDETTEALQHVFELERLHDTLGEPRKPKDILRSPPEEEETSVLDEKLEEVYPPDAIRESKRQVALTEEEGRIIDELLLEDQTPSTAPDLRDPPPTSDTQSTKKAADPESSHMEEDLPVELLSDDRPALERLDDLLEASPLVRQTYERALAMPTPSDHDACMELVTRMGVPVIKAAIPYEAEGLASSLARAGLVDYVGTEDSDVIAYEAPLLRNMSSSKEPLTLISSQRLRETTTLTQQAFLDFCILLGTDASPRIPNIGPARAFKLMLKYNSIESILAAEPTIKARIPDIDAFMAMVHNARNVFGRLPPLPEGISLEQGLFELDKVEEWLREEHGVVFMDLGDVDAVHGLVGEAGGEDTDQAPGLTWEQGWGEPHSTSYDLQTAVGDSIDEETVKVVER